MVIAGLDRDGYSLVGICEMYLLCGVGGGCRVGVVKGI